MKTFILLLLLLPAAIKAQVLQPVESVISSDYTNLIKKKSIFPDSVAIDTSFSAKLARIIIRNPGSLSMDIKKLNIINDKLIIQNNHYKWLELGITYTSSFGIKKANQQPQLQNTYAQGQTVAGNLEWRGAHQNEAFSYGPNINELFYEGGNYLYDSKGKLTKMNDGGLAAKSYHNSIIRNGFHYSQSLHTQVKLFKTYNNFWNFTILGNQSTESLIMLNNKNNSNNVSFTALRRKNKIQYSSNYFYSSNRFSNSNRSGLLNSIYKNALITPISFNNKENTALATGQRSFYSDADNPNFLLENNNKHQQLHHIINTAISKKEGNFNFDISPTYQWQKEITRENYKASTVGFMNGFTLDRQKVDKNFTLPISIKYRIKNDYSSLRPEISLNQNITAANTTIFYTTDNKKKYNYNRTSYESTLNLFLAENDYHHEYGGSISNKIYISSTAAKSKFFLPSVNFYYKRKDLADEHLTAKLTGHYTTYANELAISQSFTDNNLLQFSTNTVAQFLALQELNVYKDTRPILHKDYSTVFEVEYKHRLRFTTEFFWKNTKEDIFPVFVNNQLALKNLASHKTKGVELELAYTSPYSYNKNKPELWSTLSFTTYKTIVSQVEDGYNYTPLSGFSNVHKALVKGQQLGVIMGNSYLRDKNNNIQIGSDGFPLVDTQLGVIGNPNPNFIMKWSNSLKYKRFTISIDGEWKNGGDVWNGTQAVLDYYGKSKTSGEQRNRTNYIFNGTKTNGTPNSIPVSFYDKDLPVTQNRWVRYGYTGVAESYIQRGDQIKVNSVSLAYTKFCKKHIQQFTIGLHCNNLILWSAYKGVDSNQLLYDQANSTGLDFFNLPSTRYFGFTLTIKY